MTPAALDEIAEDAVYDFADPYEKPDNGWGWDE